MLQVGVEYYQDLLRPLVEGKKFILAPSVTNAMEWVRPLRALGAQRPLILEQGLRLGQNPPEDEAETHFVGPHRAPDVMSALRRYQELLHRLPEALANAIDEYDSDKNATVIPSTVLSLDRIAGRQCYGLRDRQWLKLDDKVFIDQLWADNDVPHALSRVLPTDSEELNQAAQEMDLGHGTAWAGDATEGFNAGASSFRWLRRDQNPREVKTFFRAHCKQVRIMPFLEGIPCSIHGFVFPNRVIALRPAEMVVLRKEGASEVVYAGNATYWDPPAARREEMRELARKVGNVLRDDYGYRGTFSIDGVMTESGFLPTELNPRWGDALWSMNRCIPDLPLALLDMALREGEKLDYQPDALEALIVDAVDSQRTGFGWTSLKVQSETTEELFLVESEDGFRVANGNEEHTAALSVGPSQVGSWVRFQRDYSEASVGKPFAPHVAKAFMLGTRNWGLAIGQLKTAGEAL